MSETENIDTPLAQLEIQALSIIDLNGSQATTTSRALAWFLQKRHDNLLRDIREVIEQIPESFASMHFEMIPSLRENSGAIDTESFDPVYRLTYDAVMLIGLSMQGSRGYLFKVALVNAFRSVFVRLEQRKNSIDDQSLREIAIRLLDASVIAETCNQIISMFAAVDDEALAGMTVDRVKQRLFGLVGRNVSARDAALNLNETMNAPSVTQAQKELLQDVVNRIFSVQVPVEVFRSTIHALLDNGVKKSNIIDVLSLENIIVDENDEVFQK
ncbi:Rha family transcriptional regulator [Candidatus Methylospira mobilis]|uniref:Rha family transcriptional regulator n=1 Tax=Candidatus Methylospira mobilis TaxID=1808979 RepID=UPI0028E5EEB0|nr:Rha family transcriptional regulator [Candidatus Methylospira mobilis]WNV05855.1 Rha family transcriptional regulator [Candidatus Methylospira mobilis]